MPNRPLSAYNLFFKQERHHILKDIQQGTSRQDYVANEKTTAAKAGNGNVGPAKFQAIARTIAGRWKNLNEEDRKVFDALAVKEMEAYKIKKAEYNRKLLLEGSTAASAEGDSLNESTSAKPTDSKPKRGTSIDSLLGRTVSTQPPTFMDLSLSSAFGMDAPSISSAAPSLASAAMASSVATLAGIDPVAGQGNDTSSWQSQGRHASVSLALQAQGLHNRLLLAEHLQRERQRLLERQLLQLRLLRLNQNREGL